MINPSDQLQERIDAFPSFWESMGLNEHKLFEQRIAIEDQEQLDLAWSILDDAGSGGYTFDDAEYFIEHYPRKIKEFNEMPVVDRACFDIVVQSIYSTKRARGMGGHSMVEQVRRVFNEDDDS